MLIDRLQFGSCSSRLNVPVYILNVFCFISSSVYFSAIARLNYILISLFSQYKQTEIVICRFYFSKRKRLRPECYMCFKYISFLEIIIIIFSFLFFVGGSGGSSSCINCFADDNNPADCLFYKMFASLFLIYI